MPTTTTIRVEDDTLLNNRIEDVVASIFTTDGSFVTSGTTNSSGEVVVSLPDASYDVLLYKQGISVLPSQPQRITVDTLQSNIFLIYAHVKELPESSDPLKCRVSGYIKGADGNPSQETQFTVAPLLDLIVENNVIIAPRDRITIQPDSTGYVQFDLIRGLSYEGYFVMDDPLLSQDDSVRLDIIVPDSPSIELQKLLLPIPIDVEFSVTTKSITKVDGPNSDVTVTITCSDGSARTCMPRWGGIKLINTDNTVVDARIVSGNLVLTPLRTGTATITTERQLSSLATWNPTPEFTSDSIVITVT